MKKKIRKSIFFAFILLYLLTTIGQHVFYFNNAVDIFTEESKVLTRALSGSLDANEYNSLKLSSSGIEFDIDSDPLLRLVNTNAMKTPGFRRAYTLHLDSQGSLLYGYDLPNYCGKMIFLSNSGGYLMLSLEKNEEPRIIKSYGSLVPSTEDSGDIMPVIKNDPSNPDKYWLVLSNRDIIRIDAETLAFTSNGRTYRAGENVTVFAYSDGKTSEVNCSIVTAGTVANTFNTRFTATAYDTDLFKKFYTSEPKQDDCTVLTDGDMLTLMTPVLDGSGKVSCIMVTEISMDHLRRETNNVLYMNLLIYAPVFLTFAAFIYGLIVMFMSESYKTLWKKLQLPHNTEEINPVAGVKKDQDIAKRIVDFTKQEREKAYLDVLTKLKNRRFFNEVILKQLTELHDKTLAFIMLDLDDFKYVNDNFGHLQGDRVLTQIARALEAEVGSDGFVIRWGGEEILVILNCNSEEETKKRGLELIKCIQNERIPLDPSAPADFDNIQRATAGCVTYPFYSSSPLLLSIKTHIALADMCLYYGKKNGKNCSVFLASGEPPENYADIDKLATDMDESISKSFYDINISRGG